MKVFSGGENKGWRGVRGVRFLIPEAFLMTLRPSFGRQWK
jgi:hypothetical protein